MSTNVRHSVGVRLRPAVVQADRTSAGPPISCSMILVVVAAPVWATVTKWVPSGENARPKWSPSERGAGAENVARVVPELKSASVTVPSVRDRATNLPLGSTTG